jgi:hypothetical protein
MEGCKGNESEKESQDVVLYTVRTHQTKANGNTDLIRAGIHLSGVANTKFASLLLLF